MDNYFTHDEIEAMKNGEHISKSFTDTNQGPVVKTAGPNFITDTPMGDSQWSSDPAPKITGNKKVTRPTIKGSGSYVTKPNIDRHLEAHTARQEAQRKLDQQIEKERAEVREFVDPKKLMATINALTRKVNRLEKQIKHGSKEEASGQES